MPVSGGGESVKVRAAAMAIKPPDKPVVPLADLPSGGGDGQPGSYQSYLPPNALTWRTLGPYYLFYHYWASSLC